MAVLIVVVNDAQEVVDVRLEDERTLLQQYGRISRTRQNLETIQSPLPTVPLSDLYLFDAGRRIRESPRLTDDQRRDAIGLYNRLLPGDSVDYLFARDLVSSVTDDGSTAPPYKVLTYFIDP